MCDWWKPYCSHSGNMRVLLLWWVFAAFTTKRCSYDRCTTVFFLNRLRLELQTAPCEGIHRKVDMKGVFRVFLRNFDNDVYSDKRSTLPKLQRFDKSQIFTRRWLTDNFHWSCTTSLSITQRANRCSNRRQWKSFVDGSFTLRICFSRIWDLAGLPYWFPESTRVLSGVLTVQPTTKDIITFQPEHAPALRIDFPSPIACSHNL